MNDGRSITMFFRQCGSVHHREWTKAVQLLTLLTQTSLTPFLRRPSTSVRHKLMACLGFLTALLQTSARKNGIAIDTLSWEFSVLGQDTSVLGR